MQTVTLLVTALCLFTYAHPCKCGPRCAGPVSVGETGDAACEHGGGCCSRQCPDGSDDDRASSHGCETCWVRCLIAPVGDLPAPASVRSGGRSGTLLPAAPALCPVTVDFVGDARREAMAACSLPPPGPPVYLRFEVLLI